MEKEVGFRESILLAQIDTEAAWFRNPQVGRQILVHNAMVMTGQPLSGWVGFSVWL